MGGALWALVSPTLPGEGLGNVLFSLKNQPLEPQEKLIFTPSGKSSYPDLLGGLAWVPVVTLW